MSGPVLLLNADYSALSLCSVRRAVVLMLDRKADLVEACDGAALHSATTTLPWPSIVRLRSYVRVPYRAVQLTRKNVLRRDRYRCQYCHGRDGLTLDHVFPKSRGGKDTWENLVAACTRCNARKGARTPDEAEMPLMRRPFRPSHVMVIRDTVGTLDDTWKPYLFLA